MHIITADMMLHQQGYGLYRASLVAQMVKNLPEMWEN